MKDFNDKYGIERYGVERWNQICENSNADEKGKEDFLNLMATDENMNRLFEVIKKVVGISNISFEWEKRNIRGTDYIDFHSSNFANTDPIVNLAWSNFRLATFTNAICSNNDTTESRNDDYYTKRATEFCYVFSLQFSYEHHGSGSNGADIGRFSVYKDRIEYYLNRDYYGKDADGYRVYNESAKKVIPFEMK